MYFPNLVDADHAESYVIGPYMAMVFTNCESAGHVQYEHVLMVYEVNASKPDDEPPIRVMAVASEINIQSQPGDGCSHFLGVFPGTGHMNMGCSDEWADLQTFIMRALEIVVNHMDIDQAPKLISRN